MKEKCNKYKQLINFGTEEELLEHISQCEDCRQEHEKMLAVSSLIQEAKPYFLKKKQEFKKLKVACVALFTLFSGVTFGGLIVLLGVIFGVRLPDKLFFLLSSLAGVALFLIIKYLVSPKPI